MKKTLMDRQDTHQKVINIANQPTKYLNFLEERWQACHELGQDDD